MTDIYIDPVDGSDFDGTTFTDGVYTALTKTLVKTGAFVNVQVGERIYLFTDTSGNITAGVYTIATKADNDTITLVEQAGADATDVAIRAGDGTVGTSYGSLVKAHAEVAAGDTVYIKNNGTLKCNTDLYAIMWENDAAGDGENPIIITTYDSEGDGSRAVVEDEAETQTDRSLFRPGGHTIIDNLEFDCNAFLDDLYENGNLSDVTIIKNCQITASHKCMKRGGLSRYLHVLNCDISCGDGFDTMYSSHFTNCRIHNSGGSGKYTFSYEGMDGGSLVLENCILTGVADEQDFIMSSSSHRPSSPVILTNCILDGGRSGYGAIRASNKPIIAINSVFMNSAGYVFIPWSSSYDTPVWTFNCCFHNNVSGIGNANADTVHYNKIEADPGFYDSDNGDYRLRPDSPLIGTGIGYAAGADDALRWRKDIGTVPFQLGGEFNQDSGNFWINR